MRADSKLTCRETVRGLAGASRAQAVQALVPGAKSVTVVDVEDEAHTKTFIFGTKLYVVQF